MDCKEAIYSDMVVDYIISNYKSEDNLMGEYATDCYQLLDGDMAVIYREEASITGQTIRQYGYLAVPKCYGLLDQSALEASGVLRLRRQPAFDLLGRGVLIGFIDTGIDYTHPAFIAADGESKIQAIWDQTLRDGDPPAGFRYGREFTNQEITDALSAENPSLALPTWDESGHGTFLAGVAAGNISRENDFSGVAPQAELLIVKCKECKQLYCKYYRIISGVPAYQENDIMAGISYLLDQANRLERPIVICIGMGTNMGNHGGDSRLGYMMDRYSGIPGVCMVVPAGNEGNARHHFYSLADARTYEFVEVDIDVEDTYLSE